MAPGLSSPVNAGFVVTACLRPGTPVNTMPSRVAVPGSRRWSLSAHRERFGPQAAACYPEHLREDMQ